ncbi:MAG: hypothetical protein J6U40_02170 [Kiritimatiellae bacterium]|nr:hypothetical protein [Kiritimatiellia bacterium]
MMQKGMMGLCCFCAIGAVWGQTTEDPERPDGPAFTPVAEVLVREPVEPLDLFACFTDEAAWKWTADVFAEKMEPYGFRFLDARKSSATCTTPGAMLFFSKPVFETRVFFGESGLRRLEFSVYNKGDAQERLTQGAFNALVRELKEALDKALGFSGQIGRAAKPRPNFLVNRVSWMKRSPAFQLEWAYVEQHRSGSKVVPYGAEYVKVLMIPLSGESAKDNAALTGEGLMVKAKNLSQLRKSVQRNAEGDVWIDGIPMVDQGEKGYCAAASSERLLRYYGLEVDQHQIAQLAQTQAEGGTSLSGMAQAIERIGRRFQLDKKDLIRIEDGKNFMKSDLMKQIEQYNAVAKKQGESQIDWRMFVTPERSVDIQTLWAEMKPEILLQSRLRQKQGFNAFLQDVKRYTDSGIPLLWSCLVGIYPEATELGQQGAFGHMRMIIGYNAKTHEILYSDTWGEAHALKRMKEENAWAMTKGLVVLKPRM